MTVATLHHPHGDLEPVVNAKVASLVEWAESAQAAHQIAESLVKTSFVPEAFRNKPHEATAAILAGAEVNLSPMAALRAFDIIQGTAAPRALTLMAVVQSRGHEMWIESESSTSAKVCGRRRGSDQVQSSTWTIDRAQKLGLTSKQNWVKQPQAMLVARATSECCRRVAADAILGIGYSFEELEDAETDVQPAKGTTRVRRAKPVTPEPAVDEIPEPPVESEAEQPQEPPVESEQVDPDAATVAQLTKLNIQLEENGYTDRDEKLRYLSIVFGRPFESSKELSKAEASKAIDAFDAGQPLTREGGEA